MLCYNHSRRVHHPLEANARWCQYHLSCLWHWLCGAWLDGQPGPNDWVTHHPWLGQQRWLSDGTQALPCMLRQPIPLFRVTKTVHKLRPKVIELQGHASVAQHCKNELAQDRTRCPAIVKLDLSAQRLSQSGICLMLGHNLTQPGYG